MWKLVLVLFVASQSVDCDKPCDGHIFALLDETSTSWGFPHQQFEDQKALIKNLFAGPYFTDFERLIVSEYDDEFAGTMGFGHYHSEEDVQNYLNTFYQSSKWKSCLPCALHDVQLMGYVVVRMTLIVFVSHFDEYELPDAIKNAQLLRDQGIRVVLVGHGNFDDSDVLSMDRLAKVTGDPKKVFKWDGEQRLPADDYKEWFKQVIDC